ncbi:hypothetical protein [Dyadobacter sp. CY312]|uniref:hypothetical protein n=1 Tax=Dyadobacter sp. CY312 TaxID=2907303 RepID=UPI001F3F6D73|nr:hypothetical protein [Dyadobacter sp. CY312]MCE7038968.1 hypothetical protein [Dyadobacter sp. CY312]
MTSTQDIHVSHNVTEFIDDTIASLEIDKMNIGLGVANPYTVDFFSKLSAGKVNDVFYQLSQEIKKNAAQEMIRQFLSHLPKLKELPFNRLAVGVDSSYLRVWVEMNEYNESWERDLYLAEAFVNSKSGSVGLQLDVFIIEKEDNFSIPSGYQLLYPSK